MMNTLPLGTYFGIPVKVHWSFLLLIGYVFYAGAANDMHGMELVWFGGYILALFLCVILHEYGHALTAKRYGIHTKDIIISPIGGVARLERLPKQPWHEFLVAIAGPLVNVAIAIFLGLLGFLLYRQQEGWYLPDSIQEIATPSGFLSFLLWINVVLFFFNLIPAFPMDGGRIIRSLLAIRFGRERATFYASILGRIIAVGFIAYALMNGQLILGVIGVFVFVMAASEYKQVSLESKLDKATASTVMRADFSRIHLSESMQSLFDRIIRGGEKNFVVFDSLGYVAGIIPELFVKDAYKNENLNASVNEYLSKQYFEVTPGFPLRKLFYKMNEEGKPMAIVREADQILGVVDQNTIQNFLQLVK